MKRSLTLLSHAKVNLRLEILKKRKDGYHEIRTIFQKISLHDTIRFSLKETQGISITTNEPDLPVGKSNLVHRSARAILKNSSYRGGISIHIEKRIPLGAGLGGGSSNAATTLKALSHLLGMGLSQEAMMTMGVKIGADVPFFFLQKGAVATGIGERLKEIDLPALWHVLIYPNFEVSTQWAYQNTRLTKKKFRYKIHKFLTTPEAISKDLVNDLEEVVVEKFPQIHVMKEALRSQGAMGTLMTGSGPTVFGVYADEKSAENACRNIRRSVTGKGWLVIRAHSLR
jgi:4-diphosphocytidyl-2-C-methyl-D-erythritol kinase